MTTPTWMAANAESIINFNWARFQSDLVNKQMIDTSMLDIAVYGLSRHVITDWAVLIAISAWFAFVVFVWWTTYNNNITRLDSFWPDQVLTPAEG